MTDASTDNVMPLAPTSPGALIKAAREKEGLHLAILSVNLKVSVKQLEALEADQFDKLIEPVFARALAAKVCRMVKLDANQVLALMPVAVNGLKPLNIIDADGEASFSGRTNDRQSQPALGRPKFLFLLIFVALLLLALNNEWSAGILGFNHSPPPMEVSPVMPPVQEPVAPDAAQNELPKAMVFEGPTNAATLPNPTAPESVPTEVKK
ncbi:RodZ family helix-turn-helix domain-containing protein [Limnohabitans sp. Rim11]|uniref:helix-turn-helix domain-containing protein n=1 Tax=Limnohabitans sp. Rim11 TaxID=1100719 RepID=UPI000AF8B4C8|nr:helix-turn-helix transcriptional regulator [Limnohabitans sp. Rim11]